MTKRNIIIIITLSLAAVGGLLFAQPVSAANCGGAETSIIDCDNKTGQDAMIEIIKLVIKILTGGVGILAVGSVTYGAILFTSAGGTPENIRKAREIWTNVAIGLLLFGFFVAITNFLVPGGVFG